MRRALILGGTGAIGRTTARRLLEAGWDVDMTGRDSRRMPSALTEGGTAFLAGDRADGGHLRAAYGEGADLIVDCACFTAGHARSLVPFARDAASTVMISSKAVYVDGWGNHSNSAVAPRFDGPIGEAQPTMSPGDGDFRSREGYGANKVAAERVLLESGAPVTVVRPSKVHGAGARRPREWVFVKRALDRRPVVLLARGGRGVDHPTAAANVAALVEVVAARPAARVLNSADPDAPSALEIERTISHLLGHAPDVVLLGEDAPEHLGRTPWDAPHPIVLDTTAARELGYEPAGEYAATVVAEIEWLLEAVRGGEDAELVPSVDDPFFAPFLDYAAEDAYLDRTVRA